jgi:2-amino-4-hydroxy-6-hydroxymethyldihydropteridine diphosphokinase
MTPIRHPLESDYHDAVLTFIGLGSNLQEPLRQIASATARLRQLPDSVFCQASSCYRSRPLVSSAGNSRSQPDYINRVVSVRTRLSPEQLLDCLQAIENEQGRVRADHWGPRVIDLDILLYGEQIMNTERLIIPHKGVKDREFVLYPLAEIAPYMILPGGEKILNLKAACPHNDIINLGYAEEDK